MFVAYEHRRLGYAFGLVLYKIDVGIVALAKEPPNGSYLSLASDCVVVAEGLVLP